MKRPALLLAVILSAAAARAEFEGVLRMKFTTGRTGGTADVFLSKKGMRNETTMDVSGRPFKTVTLFLKDKPGMVTQLRDDAKTYTEIDVKQASRRVKKAEGRYTVKDLGKETVSGYSCRHVLVTHPGGMESEMWTSRDLLDYGTFAAAHAGDPERGAGEDFLKALKDAGADGFPVKSVNRRAGGKEGVTMELVSAEKKSLSDDLFRVPASYQKVGMGPGTMPPGARKSMEEQMKSMPADKREMLEKLMKGMK